MERRFDEDGAFGLYLTAERVGATVLQMYISM